MGEAGGTTEIVVLIKAAWQPGRGDGEESLCCAGFTAEGEWVRLYPLSFRQRADIQRLKRWDVVRFRAVAPVQDTRVESLHVEPGTLEIVGELPHRERRQFMDGRMVRSLDGVAGQGRSLALYAPVDPQFSVRKKTDAEIGEERRQQHIALRSIYGEGAPEQERAVFPYLFVYSFVTPQGRQEAVFRDWEMAETAVNLAGSFGDPQTLARVIQVYGREYPQRGMLFAMGLEDGQWVVHSVVTMDEIHAPIADNLNLVI